MRIAEVHGSLLARSRTSSASSVSAETASESMEIGKVCTSTSRTGAAPRPGTEMT